MSMFRFSVPPSVDARVQQGGDEVDWFNTSSRRARIDYEQMPGLSLTAHQAAQLWNVSPDVSQRVLSSLVDVGYVKQSPSGYVRAALGVAFVSRGVI